MAPIDYLKRLWKGVPDWLKAIAGGVAAGVAYLIGASVINLDQNPIDIVSGTWTALATFSGTDWIALVAVILAGHQGVYWTPNRAG